MNKTARLAALVVLAFTLTCLCLAQRSRVHTPRRSTCVLRCASYCRALGLLTNETCNPCSCYSAAPADGGCYGGCEGGGCYGGCFGGCDGGCGWGCGGWGCDGCGGGCGGCGGC